MTRTNEQLNHSVLHRYYPHVSQILSIASYTVLYQFSPEASSWVKLEIEGTLFICELSPADYGAKRFNAVILNRRGFENWEYELRSSEDVEVTSEYIILKGDVDGEDVIYGLWIFAEQGSSTELARQDNAAVIERCAREAEESEHLALQKLAQLQENGAISGGNGYTAEQDESEVEEAAESVAMGRQLSLRELFGQQRTQDAGFAVKHHESPAAPPEQPNILLNILQGSDTQPQSQPQPPVPEKATTPAFFSNPDTDFFRSGPLFVPRQDEPAAAKRPAPSYAAAAATPSAEIENPLLALLRGNG
jgi:hypothetical protein